MTKLNPSGSALVFSTYLGGSSADNAFGLAVDHFGNMYVTGVASSKNFPTTVGAFQTTCPGNCTYYHGFVSKLGKFYTSTSLVSSLNPSMFGQSVTFTATVKPLGSTQANPTGTVTFKDGTKTIGNGAVNTTTHQAKFTTAKLSVGTHNITAVYAGDAHLLSSTSAVLKQVVN